MGVIISRDGITATGQGEEKTTANLEIDRIFYVLPKCGMFYFLMVKL